METSAYTEEWLTGPTSTKFYARAYSADSPKAVLIYVHGAAEHTGRYTQTHSALASRGVTVVAYDQRGFGRTALDIERKSKDSSYGKTSLAQQLQDLEWFVKHVHHRYPDLPIFLMGFSMGGVVILSFATCDDAPPAKSTVALLSGAIAAAPTFLLTKSPSKFVRWAGEKVRAIAPNLVYPIQNKTEDLSRNAETNKAYEEDPFVKTPGSLRGIGDALDAGEELLYKSYQNWPPELPILILQGADDQASSISQVSLPSATEQFFERLPATDKKLSIYSNACHELHNEPESVKEQYLDDCVKFIKFHLRSAS
ncbi:lysophospholipase [Laetiporus sulphureus 93-53]|uniref:Lysophospholipase n=1 Tax=Laetiporus sulphureus 93-53 TaxID=1314785 RepID=A0A165CNS8_9APHY|nr:lysophospholipase [Laetiporus sulphureus 93-53]KZT03144.1 lysophospholipase [Laetiporus sulphureus 93-53]